MKHKFESEKIVNNIILCLLCLSFFISNILVGVPTNNNTNIINIIVIVIAMIFMVSQKIIKKENIIENKIDICVLGLCLSSCIPVLFNTYTTLQGSIDYILRYIILFFIYIIVKHMAKDNKKLVGYITNITIISAVLLTIIGIDKMTTNYFVPFTNAIHSIILIHEEIRMDSLFSYANAFVAFCAFSLFLAIGNYLRENNETKKCIITSIIFILEVAIILAYSRMIFIFLAIVFLIYLLLIKDKNMRMKILGTIGITTVLAIIYSTLYMKFLYSGDYTLLWITFFIFCLIQPFILIIFKKLAKQVLKVDRKYKITSYIIICVLCIVFVIVGLNKTSPIVMFNDNQASKEVKKELYQVQGNNQYDFVFDIQAESNYKKSEVFGITILEKNKLFDDIKQTEITFGNYEGKKEINVLTDEDTTEIFILFTSEITNKNTCLKVNNLWINGKEEVLNYTYLPTNLINKIQNINFQTKSAWERGVFITDAIKLIQNNFLFGIGGDGWRYRQGEIQDYLYMAKEVHSYPIQVFLEFGIVGFIFLLGIIYFVIKKSYKYIKNNKYNVEFITILIGMLLIMLHSLLDFSMSFFCIILTMFAFLGIISNTLNDNITKKKTKNIFNIIIFIILIPILGINILNYILCEKMYKYNSNGNLDNKYEIMEDINKYPTYYANIKRESIYLYQMKKDLEQEGNKEKFLEDVNYMIKHEKYNETLTMYKLAIITYISYEDVEKYIDKVEELVNKAINTKIKNKYNVIENRVRQSEFLTIAEVIEEKYENTKDQRFLIMAQKIYEQIIVEYPNVVENVSDYQKCRYNKNEKEEKIEIIESNYQKAKNRLRD